MTDIAPAKKPTHSVVYGDEDLPFLWRQRSGLPPSARKALIHVHPNGLVEVETPEGVPLAEVKQALLKRAGWVRKHLRAIHARRAEVLERQYVSGETVFYLGRRYQLKVVQSGGPAEAKLLGGRLTVMTPHGRPGAIKAALANWYRARAHEVFARRVAAVAERLPWVPEMPDWTIRDMKTQWGSCSPSGAILLNPHLVKTPTRCIDYVILHELCHLEEHNHSPRFYKLMGRVMPDWEALKARLDASSELYLNR